MTRTHPAQALERQADLIDKVQTPLYQGYCLYFLAAKYRTLAAGRVVSRPEDGGGPIWPGDRQRARSFLDRQLIALRAAETYHVADEMTPMIGWMAGKLREADCLSAEHLPSPIGFAWFDDRLFLQDVRGKQVGIRALLWQRGVNEAGQPGIYLVHYSDPRFPDEVDASMAPADLTRARQMGSLIVDHVEFFAFGVPVGPVDMAALLRAGEDEEWATAVVDNHHRLLLGYFLLLQQKIVKTEPTTVHAGSGHRRKRRMNVPDRVQVVTLRETVYPRREAGAGADVEWQHRWPVKRHPHLYWTGPGRTIPRVVWVEAYWKGPEGAPIRITDKVYALKR